MDTDHDSMKGILISFFSGNGKGLVADKSISVPATNSLILFTLTKKNDQLWKRRKTKVVTMAYISISLNSLIYPAPK